MSLCHLLSWEKRVDLIQSSTNWVIDQDQTIQIIHNKETMHSFVSSSVTFVIPCLNVWTSLLFKYTWQKSTSNKWYISLDSCQFSQCTLCVNTPILQAVITTAFEYVQWSHTPYICCLIMPVTKIAHQVIFANYIKMISSVWQSCSQMFFHLNLLHRHKVLLS